MHDKTMKEVAALVSDFEQQTLPLLEWNHRTHLTVCCWYVMKKPAQAEELMRVGLQRFNRAHGILTTPKSGYHESLTRFWIAKVRGLVEVCTGTDIAVMSAVVQGLADKNLVLFHYSEERINSAEARRTWCEPDLRALPQADAYKNISQNTWQQRLSRRQESRFVVLSALG